MRITEDAAPGSPRRIAHKKSHLPEPLTWILRSVPCFRRHCAWKRFWRSSPPSTTRATIRRSTNCRRCCSLVSAQLAARSKHQRDETVMVSTINEVDTTDERRLEPFET